jgi:hypothetical protein
MNAVFNQLVNERGGHGALWVAELAVAKKLAELLVLENDQDPAATARAIDTLSNLLPAKTDETPLDLTRRRVYVSANYRLRQTDRSKL